MKGFSLIEILLVIGILSIIAAFTAPVAVDFYDRQVILSTSEEVYSALKKAQSFAEYRRNGSDHGVRFLTDDTYVLFQGPSYASRDSDYDEVYPLYGLSATTSPTLSNTEIRFASGTGAIIATTTLSLSKSSITKKIYLCDSDVIEYDEVCDIFDVAVFDGVDDYVDISNESNFDFESTDSFSTSAWVKTSSATAEIILDKMTGTFAGWSVQSRADTSSGVRLLIGSDGSNYIEKLGATGIDDGNWHHIVTTYDGSKTDAGAKVYIDGVEDSYDTETDFLEEQSILNDNNPQIGIRNSASNPFNGRIANVAVFDDVLTSTEIGTLYTQGYVPTSHDHLVSYWPLAGNYEDKFASNDGTQNGGITFIEDAGRPDIEP